MATILVSGLLNTETTARVRGFPVNYYPIDYPFFGVVMGSSGGALNLAKAMTALGDKVRLCSLVGRDPAARLIREELQGCGISTENILPGLEQTPASAVLYDGDGKRQIYCDLKDIQETPYPFSPALLEGADAVAACNIGFNRPLLQLARDAGKLIATDVHVLTDPEDDYNREFMEAADILFLSDEGIRGREREFLLALAERYHHRILVLGRGADGALLYLPREGQWIQRPASSLGGVVNTVGAGDALFSAFLHFYLKGLHPAEALDRAQIFAALKIRHSGAASGFSSEAAVEKQLAACQG